MRLELIYIDEYIKRYYELLPLHPTYEKAWEALEDEYKEPFVMHFHGFKYKEIADKLGIPIGTVKSRIFIARKKLMDLLPDYNYSLN